jgi:hypothetical protein
MPWIPINDLRLSLEEHQLLRTPTACPRCGVAPGETHKGGCTVERCSACAGQRFSCNCGGQHDTFFARWTGFWPGELECIALGLLCKWQPDPVNPVTADAPFRDGCITTHLNCLIDLGWHQLFHMKPSPPAAEFLLFDQLLARLASCGFEVPDEIVDGTSEEKSRFLLDALTEVEIAPRAK